MSAMTFRHWVYNLWQDACKERLQSNDSPIQLSDYFARYKWWLRREYRFQTKS